MHRVALFLVLPCASLACDRPDAAPAAAAPVGTEEEVRRDPDLARMRVAEEIERSVGRAVDAALARTAGVLDGARERAEQAEQIAREQRRYGRILAREIGWMDEQVIELERLVRRGPVDDPAEVQACLLAARTWRARLKQDLEALERTGEEEWQALRAKIERDLDDDRPPAIPRSYDDAEPL